mmetsp:Transcript_42484/g.91688  ORF Transcript_42484/g.91688 Transcript_42484/m.91688 type:complete len:642 (-) Transcript_42484:294-2219(-)
MVLNDAIIYDLRSFSLPCVAIASFLQYLRFAKKPTSGPSHRLSEKCSRRWVWVGLLLELATLRLLPLSQAYPMQAASLVLCFFWKESRHRAPCSATLGPSLAALSGAWALPFFDEAHDGRLPPTWEANHLLALSVAPQTLVFVVGMLVAAFLVYSTGAFLLKDGLFSACLPSAMIFGVSAVLLKGLVLVVDTLLLRPDVPDLWVVLLAIFFLLVGVRRVAVTPLRRALETHDTLLVLASYGGISSLSAVAAGTLVYGELEALNENRKAAFLICVLIHSLGLQTLGNRASIADRNSRGKEKSLEEGNAGSVGEEVAAAAAATASSQNVELSVAVSRGGVGGGGRDRGLTHDFDPGSSLGDGHGIVASTSSSSATAHPSQMQSTTATKSATTTTATATAFGATPAFAVADFSSSASAAAAAPAAAPAPAPAVASKESFFDQTFATGGAAKAGDGFGWCEQEGTEWNADFEELLRNCGEEDAQLEGLDGDLGPGVCPIAALASLAPAPAPVSASPGAAAAAAAPNRAAAGTTTPVPSTASSSRRKNESPDVHAPETRTAEEETRLTRENSESVSSFIAAVASETPAATQHKEGGASAAAGFGVSSFDVGDGHEDGWGFGAEVAAPDGEDDEDELMNGIQDLPSL